MMWKSNRQLLSLVLRLLKDQLRRARRRKSSGPILIAVLTVAVFGLGRFLETPDAPLPGRGEQLSCAVDNAYDGDTVTLDCPAGRLRVRVWGIDTPEMGQKPWGERSRDALRALLPGQVRVEVVDIDSYQRAVSRIYAGDQDLGLTLVRQGHAAVYRRYNDSAAYRRAEGQAKAKQRGIWSRPGAHQTPWTWRRVNPR